MANFELQNAKKKIRQAIDGKYEKKVESRVAAAVGTRHVAIDGNLANATLPDGSSGVVEVVNAGRPASARYELRSGGGVSVVSGGGSSSGGSGITFPEADTRYYTKSQMDAGQMDTRYYTETESDAKYVLLTTSVTGTGALGGGGALSSNQAITLNTPGSLTATSGNSSAANHTHAIDSTIARSAITVTGAGALGGGGALTGNQAITLNVPGSLTATSTNSSATNHTHAVTASADVGTTPAESLLKSTTSGGLTLATLTSKGNVNVTSGGDLTVGSNILFVDASGTNVGVNCAPDAQFDLDVAGNLRAQGWIVGKHAIQLKDAALIAHFDGAEPYVTNFSGEPNGHMGQPGTKTGAVTFQEAKFGKGLQCNSVTTNGCPNPSGETNMSGWVEQYDGSSQLTIIRATTYSKVGSYSLFMASTAASTYVYNQKHFHAPDSTFAWNNGETVTVSVYVRGLGTWRIVFEDAGENFRGYREVVLTNVWQRISITATNSSGINYSACRLAFLPFSSGSTYMYADAAQYEKRGYMTAYFDGSFGGDYAWSGTAHASSSTTSASGSITYNNVAVGDKWTAMIWAWREASQAHSWGYLFSSNADTNGIYYNSGNSDVIGTITASAPEDGWNHYVLVADGTSRTAYRNGVLVGTTTSGTAASSTWTVGSYGANPSDTIVDDFVLCNRAVTASEILAIYESDAPVFSETSVFHFRNGNGLVWGDAEGLWMYDTAGLSVLGVSGVDGKSWGGSTLDSGDIQFGRYGSSNGGWLRFDRNGVSSKPLISLGYGTSTVAEFDSGGSRISGTLDVTGTIRTNVSGTVYTTLNSSGLTLTEQTSNSAFGYNTASAIHQGYLTMYSGAYNGYLPSSIARRTLIEQEYSGSSGEYTQIVLQTHAPDFSSNTNKTTLTLQSAPDGDNWFEFRSAATSLSYKAYIKFESMKFSTAALGAYYGKILCRIDGSSTDRAIPIYTW
jgi:hypothetical protein